jgi:ribosomal protein S18 acetylase RimI-like enzyme
MPGKPDISVIFRSTVDPREISGLHLEEIRESGRNVTYTPADVEERWLAVPDRRFHLAALDAAAAAIAFIAYRTTADEVVVSDLYVIPAYRRQGIAQGLLAHVESFGIPVILTVAVGNFPAIGLYARTGFKTVATADGWHQMRKSR